MPSGLVMVNDPSARHSTIGKPMSSQPGTCSQSVNRPPAPCAPHSIRCPARLPADKQVVVGVPPAELVQQRAQRQRRIDATSGDDDLRAGAERRGDRPRAQVGVHAGEPRRQRRAAAHLLRARARGSPSCCGIRSSPSTTAILQRHARRFGGLGERRAAAVGIEPAGVDHDLDALRARSAAAAAPRRR